MPPVYTVRAHVVDIRSDTPRTSDRLLVDTNVWAWRYYPTSAITPGGQNLPQGSEYPAYLNRARAAGAVLYRAAWCCYVELASVVEHTEHEAYKAGRGPCTPKEYRHNQKAERGRVAGELRRAWDLIKSDGVYLPLTLDDPASDDTLSRFTAEPVDGYDALSLAAMRAAGVTQLVSDDGDFYTVAGITLFTANPRVLAARAARLLIVR